MSEISIDLSPVLNRIERVAATLNENIGVVNRNVAVVDGKVEVVAAEQRQARDRLEQVYLELREFVDRDRKEKAWQRAKSDLHTVRGEIEKKFGYCDRVRRLAVNILQAADTGLVRKETMHAASEQGLLETRFWLAPALIALSAWLRDDRALAERAAAAAIARDDNKTSLFFALVCRRAARMEATTRWLNRYFQMQNPFELDRELVVMLNGLAGGVFGGAALSTCTAVIEQWLAELEDQAGFTEEQRKRWVGRLEVMTPQVGAGEYPLLRQYSPTASPLLQSLAAARRNQVNYDFFSSLFRGELVVPPSLAADVDRELDMLVGVPNTSPGVRTWACFDDDELPLRRQERLYVLRDELEGDEVQAQQRFDAESEVYAQSVNFAALLTNAAMNPEQSGATKATQRYAVSRSRSWILAAHADLVLASRRQIPRDVEIKAGSWAGSSVDGSNQRPLQADLRQHYVARTEAAVAAVKLTPGPWIVLIGGALLGLLIAVSGGGLVPALMGLVIGGGAGAYFYWRFKNLDNVRASTRQALAEEAAEAERLLLACLAELADCRRETSAEDAKSARVTELLGSLSSPQFVLQRPETRVSVA